MRQASFREALRHRGRRCYLIPDRSEFVALLSPSEPSDSGVDPGSAFSNRIHVPSDSFPSAGIKVGDVIEDDAGMMHRVQSLLPSDVVGVRVFECATSERTDATP